MIHKGSVVQKSKSDRAVGRSGLVHDTCKPQAVISFMSQKNKFGAETKMVR